MVSEEQAKVSEPFLFVAKDIRPSNCNLRTRHPKFNMLAQYKGPYLNLSTGVNRRTQTCSLRSPSEVFILRGWGEKGKVPTQI